MRRCRATKKVKYETRKLASRSAHSVERIFGTKMEYYKCPLCKFWHLTTIKEKV